MASICCGWSSRRMLPCCSGIPAKAARITVARGLLNVEPGSDSSSPASPHCDLLGGLRLLAFDDVIAGALLLTRPGKPAEASSPDAARVGQAREHA